MKAIKLNSIYKLVTAFAAAVVVSTAIVPTASAECQQNYGGGETCVVTTKFRIKKYVRLEGDNSWKDEVLIDLNDDDENDKKILFKVEVTADIDNSENIDLDDINFDDMEMKDKWPDELEFLEDESEDELNEEWDNFKPGETKTFYFTGKIEDDEKDKDDEFEKCVVNKASLYYKDDFQASDEAVVCYKKEDKKKVPPSELPETGAVPMAGLVGISMVALGTILKKR